MIFTILTLILGLFILVKGADFFVEGASALALKFKIPQIIIGLTIVAMGTSAPEASISITSALKGSSGVAIGNVLGSNISNILLILGLTAIIHSLSLRKNSIKYEIPFMFFITILLCTCGYLLGELSRLIGFILLALFGVFLIYLFKEAKNNKDEQPQEIKKLNMFKIIVFIVGGLIALIYGSDFTVNSAIAIAKALNISERVIGLTIVAIGTSLPELVTCIMAAIKKQSDIAIGNIVGSNIFNILFVLGSTCAIQPVIFEKAFFFDGLIATISVMLLAMFTYKDRLLSRFEGVFLLTIYIGYLIALIWLV